MAFCEDGKVIRLFRAEAFKRRECLLQRCDERLRRIELFVIEAGPWLRAVQRRGLAFAELCQFLAKSGEIAGQAATSRLRTRAAQQRQFEHLDSGLESGGRAAEPAQRMLQQRQQRRRLQSVRRCLGGEPGENSRRRVRQRVAAGIVEFQVPAAERRGHAPRQRAIRCHQRRRFVHVARLAHRHRDRERLHLGIGCRDDGEVGHPQRNLLRNVRLAQPPVPLRGRIRRPHRLGDQHVAPMRRRAPQDFDIATLDAEAIEQRVHRELRMVRRRMRGEPAIRSLHTADQLPGVAVEVGVEPRQHHRAPRQAGDGMQQPRGRRHRSGRARRDDRAVMRGEADGLGLDQEVAPRRRLDPAMRREDVGPRRPGDVEEFQSELPVVVERIRHQPVERAPFDLADHHVVHQPRQIVGQRQRRGRPAGHQRRLRRIVRPDLLRPCGDQLRQQQAALQPVHRGREFPARPIRARQPARTPVRPRRCRRAQRCAAAPPRRYSARRERFPAPCARRAGSADTASPAPALPDRCGPRNPRPACHRPERR